MRSLLSDGKTNWNRDTGEIVHHVQNGDCISFVGSPDSLPCERTLNRVPLSDIDGPGFKGGEFDPVEPPMHPVYLILTWAILLLTSGSILALAIVGAVQTWRHWL